MKVKVQLTPNGEKANFHRPHGHACRVTFQGQEQPDNEHYPTVLIRWQGRGRTGSLEWSADEI